MFRFCLFLILSSLVSCSPKLPAQSSASISSGKYIFSAPALFSDYDGQIGEWLCEVKIVDKKGRLTFLEQSRGSYIDIEVLSGGNIVIVGGSLAIGEVGRQVKGSGRVVDEEQARGKLTVVSGSSGVPFVRREKSQWYLRAATKKEVYERILKGLERVAFVLDLVNIEPTLENISKELSAGEGYGYSASDRPAVMKMLEEGTVVFSNNQFQFKGELAEEEVQPAPISSETEINEIPIRNSEDLKQDFFADAVETLPKESQRKP